MPKVVRKDYWTLRGDMAGCGVLCRATATTFFDTRSLPRSGYFFACGGTCADATASQGRALIAFIAFIGFISNPPDKANPNLG